MLIIPVILSESVSVSLPFTHVRTRMYQVYLDTGWLYREYDGNLYIFSGWAITGDGEVISFPETHPEVLEQELKSADGYYCFIAVENDAIRVMKSLYRYCDIYYTKIKAEFVVGTELMDFAVIGGSKTISSNFIRTFMNDSFQAAFLSPLENTGKACSGCLTYIDSENIRTEPFVNLSPLNKNTLDVIISILGKLPSDRPLALYLSGGLDSSIVFFCSLAADRAFDVFHSLPFSFESDAERADAHRLCQKYNITLTELKPDIVTDWQNPDRINHPSDCPVVNISWVNAGDSVFIQSPSARIIRDLFLSGKPGKAFRVAYRLAALKSRSLYSVMASAVRPVPGKRKLMHPLLAAFTPGTAVYEYIEEVIRVSENTACNFSEGQTVRFSPLISLSVIRSRLAVRYEDNISAEHDRANIRRAALIRFRDNIFAKKTKRSSSQLIFRIIRQYEEELIAFIARHGKKILDNPDAMINEIKYNAHIELNASLPDILSLIKLMVFYRTTEADFFDAESEHEHF
ncbi:hypothetical protein B5O57_004587 [Salmonella enterica subsp. enterica serovar Urbana]|nr:hypothetical protein [Salmonella enterica subsp. enterica serovar Urbana]